MAEKTMPSLPSGSFDLNAILAADDMDAEIARQLAQAAAPPAPAAPAVDADDTKPTQPASRGK